jgi:transcriptional regulator NrdR family protein
MGCHLMRGCPTCAAAPVSCVDSRGHISRGSYVRRRRYVCKKCGDRWTTYELSRDRFDQLRSSDFTKQSVQGKLLLIQAALTQALASCR